jgi:hypothetical protein
LRTFVNARLRGIAELTEFSVDTQAHRASGTLALPGERQAVDVRVEEYRLEWKRNAVFVTVLDANVSRAWLDTAVRELIVGRRFRLPSRPVFLKLLA